jgi:hypothetical protein
MKNKPYDPGYTLEDCEELADEIIKSLDGREVYQWLRRRLVVELEQHPGAYKNYLEEYPIEVEDDEDDYEDDYDDSEGAYPYCKPFEDP